MSTAFTRSRPGVYDAAGLRATVVDDPRRSDVVADVAQQSSIDVICVALGVPREDWKLFARWANESAMERTLDQLHAYVDVMVANRCWRPTDDLLSDLIGSEVDGMELTTDDVHGLVATLLFAGRSQPDAGATRLELNRARPLRRHVKSA